VKKVTNDAASVEIRPEYDFSRGVRGKYAQRYSEGTNLILLDADVAKEFPTAASVNESLRGLARIIRLQKQAVSEK
jgi:hypothetical protein